MMTNIKNMLISHRNLLTIVVVAAVFFALSYIGVLKWGSLKVEQQKYITVTGTSEKQKKNEVATFNAGVTVVNSDKAKAVDEVNSKAQLIVESVKNFGVDDKDIKTASMNIFQEQENYFDNGVQRFRPGNWRTTISVEIRLRDITKAYDLASLLAKLDTTDLYGPNYAVDNSLIDEATLLSEALEDARNKADSVAASSGLRIGELLRVVEGYDNSSPVMPFKAEGMGGGGGAPLEPGSSVISKTVTATYSLK